MLTKEQVLYISTTIRKKHLRSFMLEDELIDFVSCIVEKKMESGETFDHAFSQEISKLEQKEIPIIRKTTTKLQKSNVMGILQNYFKIALRGFIKYKANSVVNVMGLVLSLSSVLIIGLYVQNELSYDKFHKDVDRIYRVNSGGYSGSSRLLENMIAEEIPGVENVISKKKSFDDEPLIVGQEYFYHYRFSFVHNGFFDVFNFPIIQGAKETLIDGPNNVLISSNWSSKIFKDKNPIGQTISIPRGENTLNFTVTGVFKEIPNNSHFSSDRHRFDIISSVETYDKAIYGGPYHWGWQDWTTYVKLKKGVIEEEVLQQINGGLKKRGVQYKCSLQPVTGIHLGNPGGNIRPEGDLSQIYTFGLIGLLILIIACINYINLATARATFRVKEVGVRKVLGAGRRQFLFQFIVEAFLVSVASLLISLLTVGLLINTINNALDLNLILSLQGNGQLIVGLLLIMTVISVVSGGYPGLYLSRFNTTSLLKATLNIKGRKISLRKILVVLQFGISASIIVCTILIVNQLNFMRSKDLGFDKEQIVYVPVPNTIKQDHDKGKLLKAKLTKLAGVGAVSLSGTSIGTDNSGGNGIGVEGHEWAPQKVLPVDFEYMKTLGMQLKAGKWFDPNLVTDVENGFVVNEAFVKYYGLEEPIGTQMKRNAQKGQIIGVVKDFHFKSMRTKIEPLVIFLPAEDYRDDSANTNLVLKLNPSDISQALDQLEYTWASIFPNRPFEWHFLDDQLEMIYRKEKVFGDTFKTFAFIAIVVSCLGLLGLVSFSAERKFKEIGIRKVLGASVSSILLLISKDFSKLIFLGLIISIPAAYFFINQWLDNFMYRINIGYWAFVVAGMVTLLIAWLTVGYISVKAARSSPIDSLRHE